MRFTSYWGDADILNTRHRYIFAYARVLMYPKASIKEKRGISCTASNLILLCQQTALVKLAARSYLTVRVTAPILI